MSISRPSLVAAAKVRAEICYQSYQKEMFCEEDDVKTEAKGSVVEGWSV